MSSWGRRPSQDEVDRRCARFGDGLDVFFKWLLILSIAFTSVAALAVVDRFWTNLILAPLGQ